ncbi:SIMPL domain-containing protein [Pleurocapsales cyanobacterium LEGE 10410]|nr:SIMPL domain-containing protein [Pleurocapsales cyanobacterium LEGE 10410]
MNKSLKKLEVSRFTIAYKRLGIVLVISSLLSLIFLYPATAQPESLKTLTVTGNGIEKIATTLAEVSLGVEIQEKTASEVQQEIAKRTAAVVDLLRSEDVQQLQTTGVRLNPNYEPIDRDNRDNRQRVITSYTGINLVSFQIPTEQVGALLDEAIEVGASRIDRISFTATPEAVSKAQKEALRKAARDAQAKGEVVLDSLNFVSKEIINIQVDGASVSQPRPLAAEQFALSESRMSTPIIGGEQTVRGSVTLQISY